MTISALQSATPELAAQASKAGDRAQPDKAAAQRADAARKFEALLVQQLVQVMRQSAKSGGLGGSEGASGQYMAMFDEMLADKMAEGGGIGLAGTLEQVLADKQGASSTSVTGTTSKTFPLTPRAMSPDSGGLGVTAPLASLQGATAKLAHAAYAISARDNGKQWAKEGTLSPEDLQSQLQTQSKDGGEARFNVLDAKGFQDEYKCNLFALEAARRAGFEVPVVARPRGWGFPTANTITSEAQQGELRGAWAEVVQPGQVADLKDKLSRGEVAIMLTGSGSDGRRGHMAVVERIHNIELDKDGTVKKIDFDGYEARADGAQHLLKRSWNRYGAGEDDPLARNGFDRIQLLALKPAAEPEKPEVLLSSGARASLKDFSSSSR